jgi:hypothetical protein
MPVFFNQALAHGQMGYVHRLRRINVGLVQRAQLQRALEQAAVLPRRQQELVVEFVNTLVQRQKRAS